MTATLEVTGTTYARKLVEGDVYVERRSRRGRPDTDDEGVEAFTVRKDAQVNANGIVKVFVQGQFRARTYDANTRVRLV